MLQKYRHQDLSEIASRLGISASSRILAGPEFQRTTSAFSGQRPEPSALFSEMRKLVRISDSLITYEAPIERALRQYKLGLEVMAPEILKSLSSKGELLLQKELCRFLLERGIFSVGTKFGRSETDLFSEEPEAQYVIETKLFRQQRLQPGAIRQAFVQLQSYLDQSPSTPRGILIVFNLTESLLTTPRRWIQGRFWILAINLQAAPPSGRKHSLAVSPGSDENLIDVVVVQSVPKRSPKRGAARARRKG